MRKCPLYRFESLQQFQQGKPLDKWNLNWTQTPTWKKHWSYWVATWCKSTGIYGVNWSSLLDDKLPGESQKESKGTKV